MLQKIIDRILRPRHYWRSIDFDELSEIYASMFLRSLALSIIAVFVPIYLYKIGFSLTSIFGMYTIWFIARVLFDIVITRMVGTFGPKHTIAFATVLHIVYLAMLMTIQDLHWPLALIALIGSFATATFVIAFEVDFSKIKHTEHGGKELGYVQIFERIGAVCGPLIGGLVASFVEPRYTIALAIVILCGSLLPIFMSAEPTHIHKKIIYRGFPYRRHIFDFISSAALSTENTISLIAWPIFISVVFLTTNTFAKLGILTSISTAVALLAIYAIGKLVDEHRGGLLLKIGTISNAILHIFRVFATGIGQALGISIINEPITVAYRLPYLKGRFDAADQVVGYRALYFMINDIFATIGNALLWGFMWVASMVVNPIWSLKASFILAAVFSLLIMLQRFPALKD
jgi:MFS family permease